MSYDSRHSIRGRKKKWIPPRFRGGFGVRCVEDDGVSPEESPSDCLPKTPFSEENARSPPSNDWSVNLEDWSTESIIASTQPQSEKKQQTDSEIGVNCISNVDKKIDTICDASNNLSTDLLSALQKNSFTDVSLKCGDYTQQAHKFILAARSPVFEAMFSTPMEESKKGEVAITDIDATVLDDLLAFIYGGQVKNMTLSKGCDLLYAAEKYQVKGLKENCINYLRSCLVIQNAVQILQFADLYDEALKKDVLNHVCNNFTALKTTEEWKILESQKPNLSIEVYSMVVEKYEERLQKM